MSDSRNKILQSIAGSADTFVPTDEMRRLKAAFWSKYSDRPDLRLSLPTTPEGKIDSKGLPDVHRAIPGLEDIPSKWWENSKFVAWFDNREEFKQRLDYLAQLALDSAEEILRNQDAPPQARVAMAKLVLEATGKAKSEERFLDQRISEMDKAELEKFIASQLATVRVEAPESSKSKGESE
jgi:hypothetical protein